MPCPICGRVMCDCSPKLRGQSIEEMMGIYWSDSKRAVAKEVPRPFTFLFTTPVEQVVKRIKNFKEVADKKVASANVEKACPEKGELYEIKRIKKFLERMDLLKVNIEEIKNTQNGKMLLCLAEVYEGRIYCPLRPSLSILGTDGKVLLKDDDRPGDPKQVLVIDEWNNAVLEEREDTNYYYAIVSR